MPIKLDAGTGGLPKPPELDAQTGLFAAAKVASATNEIKACLLKLNRQTPCPPRGAVPVNQGGGIGSFTHRTQFAFGHGGDHSKYVDRECSLVQSNGNPKLNWQRAVFVGHWRWQMA